MSKRFIFIDDSGDPGLKKSNTTHFIVAAVLVNGDSLRELSAAVEDFRAGLGWSELDELKFALTRKNIVKDFIKLIRRFDFKVCAIIIDKTRSSGKLKLAPGESLCNYAIKELLAGMELSEPSIVIDGVGHKKHTEKVRTYLRQALKQKGAAKCKIAFADSRKDPMIQLADIVAGSIARSFDLRKADSKDYVELLKPKIKDIHEITL